MAAAWAALPSVHVISMLVFSTAQQPIMAWLRAHHLGSMGSTSSLNNCTKPQRSQQQALCSKPRRLYTHRRSALPSFSESHALPQAGLDMHTNGVAGPRPFLPVCMHAAGTICPVCAWGRMAHLTQRAGCISTTVLMQAALPLYAHWRLSRSMR